MNFFYATDAASASSPTVSSSAALAIFATPDWHPLSLIIGNFDGVHKGHQELIKTSSIWSKAHRGRSVVLTFDPHPMAFLNPKAKHTRLFSLEDQKQQLQSVGVDGVFVKTFDESFRNLTAEEFLENFLWRHFHPQHLVVGHDFGFGKNRSGSIGLLEEFARKHQIQLQMVQAFKVSDDVVSTSKIRELLSRGKVQDAEILLGRPYHLRGVVVPGAQRGSGIGFPTANLQAELPSVSLKRGVYCTKTQVKEGLLPSVTNVGVNPTVSQDNSLKIETHIFGLSRPLYGEFIELQFFNYLREEKKFASLEDLKAQIQADAKQAREFFR